jgi:broad specificity phosphatase PhoE
MEIIFIRHAEKQDTGEDPGLTKKGIKQARYLAKKLKKLKFND